MASAVLTLHCPASARGLRVSSRSAPLSPPCCSTSYLGSRLAFTRSSVAPHRCRAQQITMPVRASILGVGAPEAILVGVVALLVFGPKGLARAAKSLGQTLRAFQPTIRELTQVGAELKSSLEQEIGLDEIRNEFSRPAVPPPRPAQPPVQPPAADPVEAPSSSSEAEAAAGSEQEQPALEQLAAEMQAGIRPIREQAALALDPEIERKRAEAATLAWGGATPTAEAAAAAMPQQQQQPKSLEEMSVDELEAELARRRAAAVSAGQLPKDL